tara:strand:- start:389 stop:757 length:369 start_codon:yes stop_codon:yes gene_type:complete
MTDSNIQPPDSTNDQTVNIDSSNAYYNPTDDGTIGLSDPNQDVVITTGTAADTYTVDPYAGAVDFQVDNMVTSTPDPRLDHVLEHLHSLEAKIDQIICDCNHHKEPPVYQGHVVLHANEPTA